MVENIKYDKKGDSMTFEATGYSWEIDEDGDLSGSSDGYEDAYISIEDLKTIIKEWDNRK